MNRKEITSITIIRYTLEGAWIQINKQTLFTQVDKNNSIPVGVSTLCLVEYSGLKITIKPFKKQLSSQTFINIIA